jgi:hypothetical protein
MSVGLGRCNQPRTDHDALGAERQRGHEPPRVRNSAGRRYRKGGDGVHNPRYKSHGRHFSGNVTASFDALGDNRVGTGPFSPLRIRY